MAFSGDGRFHAHTEAGVLVITALPSRGRPRRVEAPGETEALYAAGEHWLIRETLDEVSLFDAETGALLARVSAAAIRLVLPPRGGSTAASGYEPGSRQNPRLAHCVSEPGPLSNEGSTTGRGTAGLTGAPR